MNMTVKFFSKLNYSLANEDTQVERELVNYFKPRKIIAVCGAGSRVSPLINKDLKQLHIVDLAVDQLQLARLRINTIKELNYSGFCRFWGYPPYMVDENNQWRKEVYQKLLLQDNQIDLVNYYEAINWNSPLYLGKWEKTFIFFSKFVRLVMGKHAQRLFEFSQLDQQRIYLTGEFPWWRWNFLVWIIGNKTVFNRLLYKGDFIKKNIKQTYYQYYTKAFRRLMFDTLARESFFLQLCFWGIIKYPEGNIIEANEDCFEQVKAAISSTQISYYQHDIITVIKSMSEIDFISISDVPSYFMNETEKDFLQLIRPHLSQAGVIVLRNYLRVPESNEQGYIDLTEKYQDLINKESVQMYQIRILQRCE
jgi:S-adenosylmethionine-diacylglycerol 3-amino-3-carboxypropyl transferase